MSDDDTAALVANWHATYARKMITLDELILELQKIAARNDVARYGFTKHHV